MYCRNCGEEIQPNHAFCDACGASLYENGRVSESKVSEEPVENPPGIKGEKMSSASYIATVLVLAAAFIMIAPSVTKARAHGSASGKPKTGTTQTASSGKNSTSTKTTQTAAADNNSETAMSYGIGRAIDYSREETEAEKAEAVKEEAVKEETAAEKTSEAETTEAAQESSADSGKAAPPAGSKVEFGWINSPKGWMYYDESGRMLANEWLEDGEGHWFYFGEDGFMLQNTVTPDGFYVGADGEMVSNPTAESQSTTTSSGGSRPAPTAQIAGEFVFPNSSSTSLSDSDMNGKTEWECRVARNEIYARHGRKFKDSALQDYFNSCSWYKGTIAPESFRDESTLSQLEKDNIKVIEKYEKQHHYNGH